MGKDSAARIELGRSFHQMGTVKEKVSERDFVPLLNSLKYSNLNKYMQFQAQYLFLFSVQIMCCRLYI